MVVGISSLHFYNRGTHTVFRYYRQFRVEFSTLQPKHPSCISTNPDFIVSTLHRYYTNIQSIPVLMYSAQNLYPKEFNLPIHEQLIADNRVINDFCNALIIFR